MGKDIDRNHELGLRVQKAIDTLSRAISNLLDSDPDEYSYEGGDLIEGYGVMPTGYVWHRYYNVCSQFFFPLTEDVRFPQPEELSQAIGIAGLDSSHRFDNVLAAYAIENAKIAFFVAAKKDVDMSPMPFAISSSP